MTDSLTLSRKLLDSADRMRDVDVIELGREIARAVLLENASKPDEARCPPTHEAADALWKYWDENGETHKHGYYESTWGAINAALRTKEPK